MEHRRSFGSLTVALAATLALASCGGNDNTNQGGGGAASDQPSKGPVTLTFIEYQKIRADAVQTLLPVPAVHPFVTPLVYALPVQLIAYHTAVFMGTDVDQPRNLAKSVTVE